MSPLGSLQSDLIAHCHCLHLSQFHCVSRCLTRDRSAGNQLPSLPLSGPKLDATPPPLPPCPFPCPPSCPCWTLPQGAGSCPRLQGDAEALRFCLLTPACSSHPAPWTKGPGWRPGPDSLEQMAWVQTLSLRVTS